MVQLFARRSLLRRGPPLGALGLSMSRAPAVIERDGTFFFCFGNNANGGVVSSDNPTGGASAV